MEFLVITLSIFFSLALSRHSLGMRNEYQEKIKLFDESFSNQFGKLARLRAIDGVDYLGTVAGVSCAIIFGTFVLSKLILGIELSKQPFLATAFTYTLIGFFSIKWYTKPKKFSISFLKDVMQISSIAMLMPLIDIFFGIRYTPIPYEFTVLHASLLSIPLPENPHVILMGVILSLYMQACMIILWVLTSFLLALFFIPTFTFTFSTLWFCRKLEHVWGKNILNGVLVVAIIVVTYYLGLKS